MSDIHGQYDKYLRMLKKISFSPDDRLYIIGDIIDRGPDSALLLMDVLTDPRVTFLAGNHEDMMLKACRDMGWRRQWFHNGAEATMKSCVKEGLTMTDIYAPLMRSLYLVIPKLKVNSRLFYLAHASHLPYYQAEPLLYRHASEEDIEQVVWSREYAERHDERLTDKYHELYRMYPRTTMIFGHTPIQHCAYFRKTRTGQPRIARFAGGHAINIDCGCAAGLNLGCLRLEDMKEFYA